MFENKIILKCENTVLNPKTNLVSGIIIKSLSILLLILLTSSQDSNDQNTSINYTLFEFQETILKKVYTNYDFSNNEPSIELKNKLNESVQKFFEIRNYLPVWTTDYEPNKEFKNLVNILDSAKYYGFPDDYFHNQSIKSLADEFHKTKSLTSRINLEITTTNSVFKLMLYLNRGIAEKDTSNYSSFIETLPEILNNALQAGNLRNELLALQPDLVQFKNILTSLPTFIDLQLSIKFTTPKFIDDRLLAKGLYYAGITETDEIDSSDNNSLAIYKLQEKFNLPKDSVLNNPTHQFLVSLLQYRYYQACLNLHRLRVLQSNDDNFLFVNIPEFRLHVIESKQEKEAFNIIVGKQETPTPTLSSNIERVVTNPFWTVPSSIVANDMLKKIRRDSTYLKRNGFYIIDGRENKVDVSSIDWNSINPLGNKYFIRQKNSSSNALGLVKFIFPNDYDVYLHDTPSKGLFKRTKRTFSHGCIRLENPDKLAQYLTDRYFSNNDLNIKKLISSNQNNEIILTEKIKIYIQYITCSGKENFDLEFYGDIYNLDKQEITVIFPDQIPL